MSAFLFVVGVCRIVILIRRTKKGLRNKYLLKPFFYANLFMKIYMFILITFFSLIGCGNHNKVTLSDADNQGDVIKVGSTLRISLDGQENLPLNDIFQEYHFIPLETGDSILMKGISGWRKILRRDNSLYIADFNRISVFDTQGCFENFIDHKGEGPGSYRALVAFTLDSNGDVFILDRITMRIYVYSSRDEFKYAIKGISDLNITDITMANDSSLIVRSDMLRVSHMIHILDKKTGQVRNSYLPVKDHSLTFWYPMPFSCYDGKLLLSVYQNNNVYELMADSAIVRYTVNVADRLPPEGAQAFWERTDVTDMQLEFEAREKGYITHIPFFIETDSTILLRFMCNTNPESPFNRYAVINKQDGKITVIRDFLFDDLCWKPETIFPLDDGWVAIPIPAHLLFEKAPTEFRKRFPNIQEEDNPILCVGRLK